MLGGFVGAMIDITVSNINYEYNKNYDVYGPNDYINSQEKGNVANMKLGIDKM